ncbi:MAG: peptidoglycan-binding protein [Chitinophagales bacterium]
MFKTRLFNTLLVLLCVSTVAMAQNAYEDMPPVPTNYGTCYAKCKIADQYETVSRQVLVKEASTRKSTSPAVYETISDRVMTKEASKKLIPVPAVYETVTERVMIKEASTKIVDSAPRYTTTTERVLIQPAVGQWVKKKKTPNCFSANPEDCYVMCWEEIAAKYKTVSKQVLANPGSSNSVEIPAEYKTIKKRVLVSPATVREVEVPAEYTTIKKRVLASPARSEEVLIPAEYKTVDEKQLVRAGGFTQWVEILCAADTTPGVIRRVQQALTDKGYKPGPVDGVMGAQTRSALTKYQQSKGLPLGNLNKETLSSLGLGY